MVYRNKDFHEVTLEKNGEVLLRFAAAYGFHNIQNMILKLKKGKLPYHFVEVLACPRGKGFRRPADSLSNNNQARQAAPSHHGMPSSAMKVPFPQL